MSSMPDPSGPVQRAMPSDVREVIVTDIRMPFGSMVVFMVKWAVAAIPAMVIIAVLCGLALMAFSGLIAGLLATLR